MKEGKIIIGFDGDAITEENNNRIDLEDLSTTLTGFLDLVREANKLLNEDRVELKIDVEPNFKAGSFDIKLYSHYIEKVTDFLGANKNVLLALGLIAFGVPADQATLIALIKWKKDEEIVNAELIEDKIIITLADGSTKEFPSEVGRLYDDEDTREKLARLLSPLSKNGIDEFYIKNEKNIKTTSITKEERHFFAYEENKTSQETKEELRMECEIKTIDFDASHKWRLKNIDNEEVFTASLQDEEYIKQINDRKISFKAGDRIKAIFELTKSYTVEKKTISELMGSHSIKEEHKKKEYSLIKVIERIPHPKSPETLELFPEEKK